MRCEEKKPEEKEEDVNEAVEGSRSQSRNNLETKNEYDKIREII